MKQKKINTNNQTPLNELKTLSKKQKTVYVFVGNDGKPFGSVKRSFATALMKAGITDFKFHDLRHTFGSQYGYERRGFEDGSTDNKV